MVTFVPEKKDDDWSVGDIFKGAVETAGTMISGMTTGLVGQVTGAIDGYVGGLMAGMKPALMSSTRTSGLGRMRLRLKVHTYPQTEAGHGHGQVGGAMAPLEVVEPVLMPALGLPAEAAAAAAAASGGVRAGDAVDPNAGHSTKYVEDSLATNRGEGDPDYMTEPRLSA